MNFEHYSVLEYVLCIISYFVKVVLGFSIWNRYTYRPGGDGGRGDILADKF